MEATLAIEKRDTEPLTTKVLPFSRDNWIANFKYSLFTVSDIDQKHSEQIDQIFLFRNESDTPLSTIELVGYKVDGDIQEIEATARLVGGDQVDAVLTDYRGNSLMRLDSDQAIAKVGSLMEEFRRLGDEVGYLDWKGGVLVSDPERAERLSLIANNSSLRVGPIAQGVKPGNVIAVTVKIGWTPDESFLRPGRRDHLGEWTQYPTRVGYLAVSNRVATIHIDETSPSLDITGRSGSRIAPSDHGTLKRSPNNLIYGYSLFDRDTRLAMYWVWK